MGDKLVNECCQTGTCHGKPGKCNLREVISIMASSCTFSCTLVQDNCSVVVFKQMDIILHQAKGFHYFFMNQDDQMALICKRF